MASSSSLFVPAVNRQGFKHVGMAARVVDHLLCTLAVRLGKNVYRAVTYHPRQPENQKIKKQKTGMRHRMESKENTEHDAYLAIDTIEDPAAE